MREAMRSLLACLCLASAGCLQIGTDTGDAGASGTTSTGTVVAAGDAAIGTACGVDPTGTVELCEEIALCPGLGVDPTVYANCGFRVGATSPIDLECVCSNSLCPIGVANSCADATQLLAAQNALTVCEQVDEGRCIALGPAEAGTSTGTCTSDCQNECDGVPDCLVACGC
jgi:hypothetical protein